MRREFNSRSIIGHLKSPINRLACLHVGVHVPPCWHASPRFGVHFPRLGVHVPRVGWRDSGNPRFSWATVWRRRAICSGWYRCPPQGVEVKNHCTGPMKNGVESILDIGHVSGIGNNKGFETQNRFSGAGGRRVPPLPLEAIFEA